MNVAVLGATDLGRAIAEVCAVAGHEVRLQAADANAAMDGIDIIRRRVTDPGDDAKELLDRLTATTDAVAAVGGADLVVETATSDADTLQQLFADIEDAIDRETLVVPTATEVSVTAAAAGLRHPDRAVGLQFRDPLESSLVEVIVAEQTTQETCERAAQFVDDLGHAPVTVLDGPGVATTRLELALEAEAMRLAADGRAGVEAVDATLELGYDHPMGPLERADRVGLGERLETFEYLHRDAGERFEPPEILRELVASGQTGASSGEGFYVWENGEPTESALPTPEIPHRDSQPDPPERE